MPHLLDVKSSLFREYAHLVSLRIAMLADVKGSLYVEEMRSVAGSVEKRIKQFSAGRALGRDALRDFGVQSAPIPVDRCGAPIWPPGFVGSIAHSDFVVAVVVTRAAEIFGIGIDVEAFTVFGEVEHQLVCSLEDEVHCLETRYLAPNLMFSSKESAFKAMFPRCRIPIDFSALAVRLKQDPGALAGDFTVRPRSGISGKWPIDHEVSGRWAFEGGHIYCATIWLMQR